MPYPSSVTDIENRITNLANTYSSICTRFECGHPTYEGGTAASPGRKVGYLRIGTGTGGGRPRILIVAGMHARELAPPDAVLTFIEKLLAAYTAVPPKSVVYKKFLDTRSTPNTLYKQLTIPSDPDVKQIIERTELYVVPLANPDGRAFVQSAGGAKGWRKNRRPAPAGVTCPPLPAGLSDEDKRWLSTDPAGVDLNRNFDVGWDFNNYYSSGFFTAIAAPLPPVTLGVSDSPCDPPQTYHGPAASPRVREPEAQNIADLITTNKINFYMDVHSDAGQLLFPWGMSRNQDATPIMSFKNTALDRPGGPGRDPSGSPPSYAEWLPPGTEDRHQKLGDLISGKIMDSTGYPAADEGSSIAAKAQMATRARNQSKYPAIQSIFSPISSGLPPDFEPGGSDDFAFSQQIGVNPGSPITAMALDPVFSFTFECGRATDGGFQPHASKEYPKIEREVGSGLAAYLSFAATWVAPVPPPLPAPSPSPVPVPTPTPSPSTGSNSCPLSIICDGSRLYPYLRFLRNLRDYELRTTKLGRRFLHPIERTYHSFSPYLVVYLSRHPVARAIVREGIVGPALYAIRGCAAALRRVQPQERRVQWLVASLTGIGIFALSAGAVLGARIIHTLTSR